jgi:endonuclease YncB( thermonuclease family)
LRSEIDDVKDFVRKNPSLVTAKNELGQTPLHITGRSGNKELMEFFLSKGADVNAKDGKGWTPLHWACFKEYYSSYYKESIEFLISKGADVNAKDELGKTPLHIACRVGNKKIVELLLSKNADVNAKDKSDQTPLNYTKNWEIADLLKSKGAELPINKSADDSDNDKTSKKSQISYKSFTGTCKDIVNGSTITAIHDGQDVSVKLYSAECPENGQSFFDEAKAFTSNLIQNKTINVDVIEADHSGNCCAIVKIGDKDVGYELLKSGLAWYKKRFCVVKKEYVTAEKEAKEKKVGLWSESNPVPPWTYRENLNRGKMGNTFASEYIYKGVVDIKTFGNFIITYGFAGGNGKYVTTGVVQNDSSQFYSVVYLDIIFYDSKGVQVRSVIAKITSLEPKGKAEFRESIYVDESSEVSTIKLDRVRSGK